MKIKSITLYNYPRIKNTCKGEVVIPIETSIVTIIGTNGSGKSSLLGILTPYLTSATSLDEGGYIKMEISYLNHTYDLSIYQENKQHSFVRDGIELNENGLYSTYKYLVEEYFISKELFDFLIGTNPKDTLPYMSVMDRRNLLTDISPTDFDLLNGIYKQSRDRLKYLKNIITHESSKLTDSDGLITAEVINKVKKEIEELEASVLELSTNLVNVGDEYVSLNTITDLKSTIDKRNLTCNAKREELNRLVTKHDETMSVDLLSINSIERDVIRYKGKEELLNSKLAMFTQELNEAEKILTETNDQHNLHKTVKESKDRLQQIALLINKYTKQYELKNKPSKHIHEVLTASLPTIHHCLADMPNEQLMEYTLERYDAINKRYNTLLTEINKLTNNKEALLSRLASAEKVVEDTTVSCPKCKHSFTYADVSQEDINKLTYDLKEVSERLKDLDTQVTVLRPKYEYINSVHPLIQRLITILNVPELQELSSSFSREGIFEGNKATSTSILNGFEKQTTIAAKYSDLLEEKAKLENRLKDIETVISESNTSNLRGINTKIHTLKDKIASVGEELSNVSLAYRRLLNIKATYNEFDTLKNTIDEEKELLNKYETLYSTLSSNNEINKLLRELRTRITNKRIECNTLENNLSNTIAINESIKKYTDEETTLKQVHDSFNPNKGFIAHVIRNSINLINHRVNVYLNDIWSTDIQLEIIPDTGTVDYKFWTIVEGNRSPINAVNKATMDIISFIFKIVIAETAGLQGYPIYIDELGSSFDEVHRDTIFKFINDKLVNNTNSTIFLVSHFDTSYSILDDNTVTYLVLDDQNIRTNDLTGTVKCI